jgi:hypothetical protein
MVEPKHQASYINIRKSYPQDLVDHMPKILSNYTSGYTTMFYNADEFKQICIREKRNSHKDYSRLKDLCTQKSTIITSSVDTCLTKLSYSTYKDRQSKNKGCVSNIYVPGYLFEFYDSDNRKWESIDSEFELYLIDSSKEIPSSLNNTENEQINYSRGYAFNDNDLTITYWIITW